jgi:paraquat-inducible protein A
MFRHTHDSVRRTLCHTLAAVILFAIANLYPFMTFELHGREQEAVLFTGIRELHAGGFTALGALVLFTTIAAPALYFAGLLYMLVPLSLGRVPPRLAPVYRWTELLRPWGMIGVLMLGALVAIIKLVALANVELGIAFYALIGLMIFTAETQTTFDPEAIWQALEAGQ